MKAMKRWTIIGIALFFLAVQGAYAHVTVLPGETAQGRHEVFTIRVPNERDTSTVQVELAFSDQVEIGRVQPLAGWSYEWKRNEAGDNVGIVWSAEGEGIRAEEFGEFRIQGRVADQAGEIVWKAYQTYADGTVVEWTGAPGSDQPASVTKVAPGSGQTADDHHGAARTVQTNRELSSSAYIGLAALALSVFSLAVSFRRRLANRQA